MQILVMESQDMYPLDFLKMEEITLLFVDLQIIILETINVEFKLDNLMENPIN